MNCIQIRLQIYKGHVKNTITTNLKKKKQPFVLHIE